MRALLFASCLISGLVASAVAAVPTQLTVQGRLTDSSGTSLPPGLKTFTFKIFDDSTGGTEIWPGGGGNVQMINTIAGGLWTAFLVDGDWELVFGGPVKWLEVTVDPGSGAVTLPRVPFTAHPYSVKVETVDSAGGGAILGDLTVGFDHEVISVGNFVAGSSHAISGDYSTIAGGEFDTIGSDHVFIGGGHANRSDAANSVIGGGQHNLITNDGFAGTIGGGDANKVAYQWGTVSGGIGNVTGKNIGTVGGGGYNRARGEAATVAGGGSLNPADSNTASGDYSAIGGGAHNLASGTNAVIAGGYGNVASGFTSGVHGGNDNVVSGAASFIGGGVSNSASGRHAVLGGGFENQASADTAVVGGGARNSASGISSTIMGGTGNHASGDKSFVGGGESDTASGDWATVAGGWLNRASGIQSVISGGYLNESRGTQGVVPGGACNGAVGVSSFAAGVGARANHRSSFVWNGAFTCADSFATTAAQQFLIHADGGVGVGTNAPEAPLHVLDGSAGTVTAELNSTLVLERNGSNYLSLLAPDNNSRGIVFGEPSGFMTGGIYYNRSAQHAIEFRTNGDITRMSVGATGRVGIGTLIPEGNLHVVDASAGAVTANASSSAVFESNGDNYLSILSTDAGSRGIVFGEPSNALSGGVYYDRVADNTLDFRAGVDLPHMVITPAGSVGIGTSTPETVVHIQAGSAGTVTAHASSKLAIEHSTNNIISLLTPVHTPRGIAFGEPGNNLDGAVFYAETVEDGLEFRTNGSVVRMVIDSLGNVGIGDNSPEEKLDVVGDVAVTGTICATGAITGNNLACPSDARFKRGIRTLPDALDKVERLRGVNYEWKTDEFADHGFPAGEQIGLVAQEVKEIVPQAVVAQKDGYLAVDYARLVPLLIEAIKEQQRRIESLEQRLEQ